MIGESIVLNFRHADTYLIRVSPQLHHVDDTVNKFLTYHNGRAAATWEHYKGAWGVMDAPDAHLFLQTDIPLIRYHSTPKCQCGGNDG